MRSATSYSYVVMLVVFVNTSTAQTTLQHVIYKGDNEIGWEIKYAWDSNLAYRISGHDRVGFQYKESEFVLGSASFDHKAISTLVDWHPFEGDFRTSAGIFISAKNLELSAEPTVEIKTDRREIYLDKSDLPDEVTATAYGRTITVRKDDLPDKIVIKSTRISFDHEDFNAKATANFKNVSPYFGFGWGNRPDTSKRFHYSVDVGVLYNGAPSVYLDVGGQITQIDPRVSAELRKFVVDEQQRLQSKAKRVSVMPYLAFGASMSF